MRVQAFVWGILMISSALIGCLSSTPSPPVAVEFVSGDTLLQACEDPYEGIGNREICFILWFRVYNNRAEEDLTLDHRDWTAVSSQGAVFSPDSFDSPEAIAADGSVKVLVAYSVPIDVTLVEQRVDLRTEEERLSVDLENTVPAVSVAQAAATHRASGPCTGNQSNYDEQKDCLRIAIAFHNGEEAWTAYVGRDCIACWPAPWAVWGDDGNFYLGFPAEDGDRGVEPGETENVVVKSTVSSDMEFSSLEYRDTWLAQPFNLTLEPPR